MENHPLSPTNPSPRLFERTRGESLFGVSGIIGKIIRVRESFFIILAILWWAFFLLAAPIPAQSVPNSGTQSATQVQSSMGINQPSQRAFENLASAITESPASESRIGPDDLLNISVFEAPELSSIVRVSSGGQISLQLLGAVHAAGLTPRELESVLQGLLSRNYMKDPHVSVFVQELQSHSVSVVGAVKMPGVFQIRGTKTVIEVLSLAQGLADDAGNEVLIMHGAEYKESGSPLGNGSPSPGIATTLPYREVFPRAYESPSTTSGKSDEIVEVNLKKLLESTESVLNVPVRPGDIVKVPRAGIVYVVGEVTKPGGFVLRNNEDISVLQALALAEGTTHTSAISRARIIRTNPDTGKQTEIPLNLGKILSGKKPDSLLQPKDIVFVPNSAAKSVFYRGSEAALQTAAGIAIYRW
jgi:polysaccharide export outer membrane protein